jgi:Flp pilus assembly protein TadG
MIDRFSRLAGHAQRLCRDDRGAVAFVFAAMMPALLGGLALAVDVSMYRIAHSRLQAAADAAALAGLQAHAKGGSATTRALEIASANVPTDYGAILTSADIELGMYSPETGFVVGGGANANAVRVAAARNTARGNAVPQIFSALFTSDRANISVAAIAARPINVFYEPPELTNLDNEAGDFNELYVYCFDSTGTGSPESRRSQMTLMSSNMPSNRSVVTESGGIIPGNPSAAEDLTWPSCNAEGQTLSFRLRNVRHAKSHKNLWASPGATIGGKTPGRPEHNHYTDTVVVDGKEAFPGLERPIVETVRCDTLDKCNTAKSGNIIPSGKNRTPALSPVACEPGKFMYFGWEDRPQNMTGASGNWLDPAWTDRDFNDIVVVMRCPRSGQLGDGLARLVG